MSYIFLKVTIETFSKLPFSGFKKFVTRSVFWELPLMQISLNFKTSCCDLKTDVWEQNFVRRFYHFNFERNYDVLKSKSQCTLLNKNINLIKTKRNRKWKIPHTVLERQSLCFSSYKNRKLKVKPCKRVDFWYSLFCSKGIFLRFAFYLNV